MAFWFVYAMKTLIKYLSKREKMILRVLATPRSRYTKLTFHNLRIELKKLNALFEILGYCSPEFKRKGYFKPFKILFKQAGKVRELQITEALLNQHVAEDSLTQFGQYITMQMQKAEDVFFSLTTKSKRAKLKKQLQKTEPFTLQAKRKKILNYLEKERKKIENLMTAENIPTELVHTLRKRIKTYNYNRRILEKSDLSKKIFSTDHLSDLLGQWHDLRITLGYIQSMKKSAVVKPEESAQLLEGERKMTVECNQLFEDILNAVPSSEFYKGR